jgi:SAM-dependent methyltransferase
VVGVDESKEMLAHGRAADERIEWVVGDMRSRPVEGTFDLVICCFNTLQLLLSSDDLARTFRAVRRLLSPDGIFAFDIYQPSLEYLSVPQTDRLAWSVTDDQDQLLEIREDTTYDARSRCLIIDWRLVAGGETEAVPRACARYCMRQYFPDEVDRLLMAEKLAVRERYGDLDRSPFTPASKKQVLVCAAG